MSVQKTIRTPAEYKEATEAADILGLKLSDAYFTGCWETQAGSLSWPRNSEIHGAGRKYFQVDMDGETYKIQAYDPEACVTLTFE